MSSLNSMASKQVQMEDISTDDESRAATVPTGGKASGTGSGAASSPKVAGTKRKAAVVEAQGDSDATSSETEAAKHPKSKSSAGLQKSTRTGAADKISRGGSGPGAAAGATKSKAVSAGANGAPSSGNAAAADSAASSNGKGGKGGSPAKPRTSLLGLGKPRETTDGDDDKDDAGTEDEGASGSKAGEDDDDADDDNRKGDGHGSGSEGDDGEEEDEDDDADSHASYCAICKDDEEGKTLVLCERCPRAFHPPCIGYEDGKLPPDPWYCSKCTEYLKRQEDRDAAKKARREKRASEKEAAKALKFEAKQKEKEEKSKEKAKEKEERKKEKEEKERLKEERRKAREAEKAEKAAKKAAPGDGSIAGSTAGTPVKRSRASDDGDAASTTDGGTGGSVTGSTAAAGGDDEGKANKKKHHHKKAKQGTATGLASLHASPAVKQISRPLSSLTVPSLAPESGAGTAGTGSSSSSAAGVSASLLDLDGRVPHTDDAAASSSSTPAPRAPPPPPPEPFSLSQLQSVLSALGLDMQALFGGGSGGSGSSSSGDGADAASAAQPAIPKSVLRSIASIGGLKALKRMLIDANKQPSTVSAAISSSPSKPNEAAAVDAGAASASETGAGTGAAAERMDVDDDVDDDVVVVVDAGSGGGKPSDAADAPSSSAASSFAAAGKQQTTLSMVGGKLVAVPTAASAGDANAPSSSASSSSGTGATTAPSASLLVGLAGIHRPAPMQTPAKLKQLQEQPNETTISAPLGAVLSAIISGHREITAEYYSRNQAEEAKLRSEHEAKLRATQSQASGAGAGAASSSSLSAPGDLDEIGIQASVRAIRVDPRKGLSPVVKSKAVSDKLSALVASLQRASGSGASATDAEMDDGAGDGASSSSSSAAAAAASAPFPILPGLEQLTSPISIFTGNATISVSKTVQSALQAFGSVDWSLVDVSALPHELSGRKPEAQADRAKRIQEESERNLEKRQKAYPILDELVPFEPAPIDAATGKAVGSGSIPVETSFVRDTYGLTDAQFGDLLQVWDFLRTFGTAHESSERPPLLDLSPDAAGEELVVDPLLSPSSHPNVAANISAAVKATMGANPVQPLPLPMEGQRLDGATAASYGPSSSPAGGEPAAAGTAGAATADTQTTKPVSLCDPSISSLSDLISALRGVSFRGYRFLARAHIAMLKLLIQDRNATLKRKKDRAAQSNKRKTGGGDDDEDDDDEDDEDEDEDGGRKGSGKAGATRAKRTSQDVIAEGYDGRYGERERDIDIMVGQLSLLTWPEVVRRALLFGPLGAYIRPHLSPAVLQSVANLADTDYSSMTFEDRLMVLRGLVDAVTATDRFGEYIDQTAAELDSLMRHKEKEDEADEKEMKELIAGARERLKVKEEEMEPFIKILSEREKEAKQKAKDDKKAARQAAMAAKREAKAAGGGAGGAGGAGNKSGRPGGGRKNKGAGDAGASTGDSEAATAAGGTEAADAAPAASSTSAAAGGGGGGAANAEGGGRDRAPSFDEIQLELAGLSRTEIRKARTEWDKRKKEDTEKKRREQVAADQAERQAAKVARQKTDLIQELMDAVTANDSRLLTRAINKAVSDTTSNLYEELGRGKQMIKRIEPELALAMRALDRLKEEAEEASFQAVYKKAVSKRHEKYIGTCEELRLRAVCLGQDRDYRSYWLFASDKSRVYVEEHVRDASATDEAKDAARERADAAVDKLNAYSISAFSPTSSPARPAAGAASAAAGRVADGDGDGGVSPSGGFGGAGAAADDEEAGGAVSVPKVQRTPSKQGKSKKGKKAAPRSSLLGLSRPAPVEGIDSGDEEDDSDNDGSEDEEGAPAHSPPSGAPVSPTAADVEGDGGAAAAAAGEGAGDGSGAKLKKKKGPAKRDYEQLRKSLAAEHPAALHSSIQAVATSAPELTRSRWYYLDNYQDLKAVAVSLDVRGQREANLSEMLQRYDAVLKTHMVASRDQALPHRPAPPLSGAMPMATTVVEVASSVVAAAPGSEPSAGLAPVASPTSASVSAADHVDDYATMHDAAPAGLPSPASVAAPPSDVAPAASEQQAQVKGQYITIDGQQVFIPDDTSAGAGAGGSGVINAAGRTKRAAATTAQAKMAGGTSATTAGAAAPSAAAGGSGGHQHQRGGNEGKTPAELARALMVKPGQQQQQSKSSKLAGTIAAAAASSSSSSAAVGAHSAAAAAASAAGVPQEKIEAEAASDAACAAVDHLPTAAVAMVALRNQLLDLELSIADDGEAANKGISWYTAAVPAVIAGASGSGKAGPSTEDIDDSPQPAASSSSSSSASASVASGPAGPAARAAWRSRLSSSCTVTAIADCMLTLESELYTFQQIERSAKATVGGGAGAGATAAVAADDDGHGGGSKGRTGKASAPSSPVEAQPAASSSAAATGPVEGADSSGAAAGDAPPADQQQSPAQPASELKHEAVVATATKKKLGRPKGSGRKSIFGATGHHHPDGSAAGEDADADMGPDSTTPASAAAGGAGASSSSSASASAAAGASASGRVDHRKRVEVDYGEGYSDGEDYYGVGSAGRSNGGASTPAPAASPSQVKLRNPGEPSILARLKYGAWTWLKDSVHAAQAAEEAEEGSAIVAVGRLASCDGSLTDPISGEQLFNPTSGADALRPVFLWTPAEGSEKSELQLVDNPLWSYRSARRWWRTHVRIASSVALLSLCVLELHECCGAAGLCEGPATMDAASADGDDEEDEEDADEEEEEAPAAPSRKAQRRGSGNSASGGATNKRARRSGGNVDESTDLEFDDESDGDDDAGGGSGEETEEEGHTHAQQQRNSKKAPQASKGKGKAAPEDDEDDDDGGDESDESDEHDDACFVCGKRDHKTAERNLLLCDGCPHVVHVNCAGLKRTPPGDFFCSDCKDSPCGVCGKPVKTAQSIVCGPDEKSKSKRKGCETPYHLKCVGLKTAPKGDWFCDRGGCGGKGGK